MGWLVLSLSDDKCGEGVFLMRCFSTSFLTYTFHQTPPTNQPTTTTTSHQNKQQRQQHHHSKTHTHLCLNSCAFNEIGALRDAFGPELLPKLMLLNTKGYTGHAMGVSFEDVAAVEILHRQVVSWHLG